MFGFVTKSYGGCHLPNTTLLLFGLGIGSKNYQSYLRALMLKPSKYAIVVIYKTCYNGEQKRAVKLKLFAIQKLIYMFHMLKLLPHVFEDCNTLLVPFVLKYSGLCMEACNCFGS